MVESLFDKTGEDAVVLRVHVQPGAGRTAVVGTHGNALKIRVAAPPTGGRANAAAAELVAEVLGVKAAEVVLEGGEASRSKRFAVRPIDPADVLRRLEDALATAAERPGVHRPTHR